MEIDEQVKVVTWCELHGIPVFHIVNEGKRTPWSGRQLVAAGLRRGVPDLCIPQARGGYHALYIEMKYGKNKLTEDQKYWLRLLKAEGNATYVAYSFEEAKEAIKKYLQQGV